jgi:alkylhydroperoxidase family enzyme
MTSGTRRPGFGEADLAALIRSIATINVWNRLNVAIKAPVEGASA